MHIGKKNYIIFLFQFPWNLTLCPLLSLFNDNGQPIGYNVNLAKKNVIILFFFSGNKNHKPELFIHTEQEDRWPEKKKQSNSLASFFKCLLWLSLWSTWRRRQWWIMVTHTHTEWRRKIHLIFCSFRIIEFDETWNQNKWKKWKISLPLAFRP